MKTVLLKINNGEMGVFSSFVCGSCFTPMKLDDKFCKHCGKEFKNASCGCHREYVNNLEELKSAE